MINEHTGKRLQKRCCARVKSSHMNASMLYAGFFIWKNILSLLLNKYGYSWFENMRHATCFACIGFLK